MKSIVSIFLILFSIVSMAQESFLADQNLQRQKELRNARLKETPGQPIQALQKTTNYLFTPKDGNAQTTAATFKNEGVWLSWDSGENFNAIGTLDTPLTLDAAIRFEPADLEGLEGSLITRIRVFLADNVEVTLKVWQGDSIPQEIYAQDIAEYNIGSWTEVELANPVVIDTTQDLLIGYKAVLAPGTYPIGVDEGPTVSGKGDLIQFYDETGFAYGWETLTEYMGPVFNWNIQALAETMAEAGAPAAPENLLVAAGSNGQLTATLEWTNPSLTFDGQELTSLDNISVYRGQNLIQTINNPQPGAAESLTDENIPTDDMYVYKVVGENQVGQGASSFTTVFVGEDVPAAPLNATLIQEEGSAVLTWDAPLTGNNDGYIDPALTRYSVMRMPGNDIIAEDLASTSLTDTENLAPGNYFYKITASNNQGSGGTANSNVVSLGIEGKLFFEAFDYSPGSFPLGWQLEGIASENWSIIQTNVAGGIAPELVMSWHPETIGTTRMISPDINADNYTGLRISFKQFLDNFDSFNNESVAIEFRADNNGDWQTIWEQALLSEDIAQEIYDFQFSLPENTSTFQIAFRFEGNSYNINYWYIDDLSIEPLLGNNLAAKSVSGNIIPTAETESIYTVTVANVGEFTATDYTVKLMGEGDTELVSVSGEALQSGQTIDYQLPWTPTQPGATFIYARVDYAEDEFNGNNSSPLLQLQVQPEGTLVVEVGNDNFPSNSIPFNFFWQQSLSQTIYFSEELGISGGLITSLKYSSMFAQSLGDKEVRVWLAETDQNDLSEQEVAFENFVLVFEGMINFPQGENEIIIPFDNPYAYTGRNLVVYTDKVWENNYYGSGNSFIVSHDSIVRTRSQVSEQEVFPESQSLSHYSWQYPNTTFFFSLEGLGGIEGTITQNNEPVEGVKVKIANKPTHTQTNQNGFYSLPYLIPGEYDLEISKFGYLPQTISTVVIAEEETTTVDVEMEAIAQYVITGAIEGNDGLIPNEVTISLKGYDNYSVNTDNSGIFALDSVYEGEYLLTIYAPGYDFYRDENFVVSADTDLGVVILSEIILAPGGLAIDYDNVGAGNALLTWKQTGELTEFRYDSGIGSNIIGTDFDMFDAVIGSAHPSAAILFDMSFVVSNGSVPLDNDSLNIDSLSTETVRVRIFGLDENNLPDRNQLLYTSDDILVNNSGWTTYQFSEPIDAPNGFFMGISTESFLFFLTDDGMDPNWPFQNNTHFVNFNVTSDDFHPLELFGYQENLFIRANGYNLGTPKSTELASTSSPKIIPDHTPERQSIEPFSPASPFTSSPEVKSQKSFTGFNVYLNDLETPVAFTEEPEYLFTEIPEGDQVAGVQSVYTTGVSEIVTLDFVVVYPVEVTLNVSTNSGISPEGASITLTNQEDDNYSYSATADETGLVFFEAVRKGTYTLQASLENFQSEQISNLIIQENTEIDIEFTEVIAPPANLMVLTDGLEAGQALFSWNNPTQGWTESFEEGIFPENWSQIITNTGSQAGFDATWRIVETVDFSNNITPQNGTYQAYVMWSFEQQDEWLISPEFTAPAGNLVFWYHGITGSTFGDNYFVKITTDDGNTWTELWNASNLPSGLNHFTTPAVIDLSFYAGKQVKLAWHADDGPEDFGLWSSWAIDNVTVGGDTMNLKDFAVSEIKQDTPDKNVLGYNVYLDGVLVAENVQETQYLFNDLADGPRVAGVEAVYATGTSDRVIKEFLLSETWLLSLASNPAGSSSLSGAAWYAEGSEVLVNALPNEGFTFVNWTNVAGEVVSDQPGFFYTMPGNDAVLIANFEEIELFSVTFNIDMSAMPGYNPFTNDVALTGSMHNWAVLGANHRNQTMAGDHTSMIYTKNFTLAPGTYQYKYFLNEGQHDNEWEDGDNREITVNNNIVVNDVWGVATQVEDISDYAQVQIFPNPFTNHLELVGADLAERIVITNMLGKVIMDEPITGNRIDTSSLPAGVYVIYLEGSTGAYPVQKVIKQ